MKLGVDLQNFEQTAMRTEDAKKVFMKPWRSLRSVDWAPWLAGLLALLAMQPLLAGRLTRSTDGLLHLYRLVEFDRAIREGVLLPRWFPDLAGGYGVPLLNFYPPLAYYPIELLHLAGLSLTHAQLVFFGLTLWLAGGAMFLWVRDVAGAQAGLLAVVAYTYAPYVVNNAYGRSNPSEALALALAPLLFWAFRRLALATGQQNLAVAAITYTALIATHFPSTLIFSVTLVFYLGLLAWLNWPHIALRPVASAIALSLGLSAFVWAPAWLEKGWVQLERMREIHYAANFLSPSELLSWPGPVDRRLINPNVPRSLGPALVVLAAIGALIGGAYGERSRKAHVWAACTLLVVSIALTLPLSQSAWDQVPLLADLQLPRRFLAPATLAAAFLAAQTSMTKSQIPNPKSIRGSTIKPLVIGIGSLVIILSSLPWLFPHYDRSTPETPTIADLLAFEEKTGAIGTTATGEYLPIWGQEMPPGRLATLIRTGAPVERLDPARLPQGAEIQDATYGFTSAHLRITSPEPFQAVYESFYFPGWRAYIDGQAVPVTPNSASLISFLVPAGLHTLVVRFEDTPVRTASMFVSITSAMGLTIIAVRRRSSAGSHKVLHNIDLKPGLWLAAGLLVAIGFVAKTLYLDRFDTWLAGSRFDGQQLRSVTASRRDLFGDQLILLGYDLSTPAARAGEPFRIILYWQANRPLAANYSTFVHLLDDARQVRASSDHVHPGNLPTTRWELDEYAQDVHVLDLPRDLQPGPYTLTVGVSDPAARRRLEPPPRGEVAVGQVQIQN